jgi:MFS-type transporter involved in bile tolerance (Atg22 family)
MIHLWSLLAMGAAGTGAVVFVAAYSVLTPWYRTRLGRNVMLLMISSATIMIIAAVGEYTDWVDSHKDVLRAVVATGVAVAVWQRVAILVRGQLDPDSKGSEADEDQ